MYTEQELKRIFTEIWNNCSTEQKVELHNKIVEREKYYDDAIYLNDWDKEPLASMSKMDAIRAICYGDYVLGEKYIQIRNNNLYSFSYWVSDYFFNMQIYFDFYYDNPELLSSEFKTFQEIVNNNE